MPPLLVSKGNISTLLILALVLRLVRPIQSVPIDPAQDLCRQNDLLGKQPLISRTPTTSRQALSTMMLEGDLPNHIIRGETRKVARGMQVIHQPPAEAEAGVVAEVEIPTSGEEQSTAFLQQRLFVTLRDKQNQCGSLRISLRDVLWKRRTEGQQ